MTRAIDVAAAVGAELGEGPVWLADQQVLQWVDVLRGRVMRSRLQGPYDWQWWDVAPLATTASPATGGRTVVSTRDEVRLFDSDLAGPGLVLASLDLDGDLRFNDGAVAPDGSLLVGTMSTSGATGTAGLYRIDRDGGARQVFGGVSVSNGIGWTADPEVFFYVDSGSGCLELVRWDLDPATAPHREVIAQLDSPAVPDGLAVDTDGCAWVACWDGGVVRRYTPEGRCVDEIAVPVSRPTSCAFGGPELSTLFVTTARYGLTERELCQQPLAGDVLAVDVGYAGLAGYPSIFQA